jgi:hypothetical protein
VVFRCVLHRHRLGPLYLRRQEDILHSPCPSPCRDSLHVRELPTQIRRIRDGIRSKHWRLRSRKKCNMQRTTRHVSHHPLRIVRTAQAVPVQKFPFPRHDQSIQTATSRSRAVRVEESARLYLLKPTYSSDGKAHKIDRNLLVRKGHVPRNRLRGRTCRTPVPFILSRSRHAPNQHQPCNCAQYRFSLHPLSMASQSSFDQLTIPALSQSEA